MKLLTEGRLESELESGGSWSDGSGNIESKLVDEAIRNWDIEEDFSMIMFGQTLSGTKYHRGNTSDTLELQKETTVTGETESSTHTGKRTMTGTETKGVTAANGTLLNRTASFSESESQNTAREITYDYDEQAETWTVSGGTGAFSGSRIWSYLYDPKFATETVDMNIQPNMGYDKDYGTLEKKRTESGCYSDFYFGTESYDGMQDTFSPGSGFGFGSGSVSASYSNKLEGTVTGCMITPSAYTTGTYDKTHIYSTGCSFAGVFTLSGGQWNSVWTGEYNRNDKLVYGEIASGSFLNPHRTETHSYYKSGNYRYSETELWTLVGGVENTVGSRTTMSDTRNFWQDHYFSADYGGWGNAGTGSARMSLKSDKITFLGATLSNSYNHNMSKHSSGRNWDTSYVTSSGGTVTMSRTRPTDDFSIVYVHSANYTRQPGFNGYVPESIPLTTEDTYGGDIGGWADSFPYLGTLQGLSQGVTLSFNGGGGVGVTFSETPVTLPLAGITHDYDKYVKRPPEKPMGNLRDAIVPEPGILNSVIDTYAGLGRWVNFWAKAVSPKSVLPEGYEMFDITGAPWQLRFSSRMN